MINRVIADIAQCNKNHTANKASPHFRVKYHAKAGDKAKHKILPPSKFGLIQMTRQRVRPEKYIETNEENPNVDGEIHAPIVIVERIDEAIRNIMAKEKGKLFLHVHPFIEAFLTKGLMSIQMK